MAQGREAASGWANPIVTGGFLNWIICPWWKQFVTKITLQYTAYSHFNGSRSLYDGNGANIDAGTPADTFPFPRRNASANNSLYLLVWQTF